MSRGLPPAYRQWLNDFDAKAEIWDELDLDDVRGRVAIVLDHYPAPPLALARMFMEQIGILGGLIGRYETVEDLERAIRGLITNQGVIASALSRRGRGKPEL
jgi:hypothetical protein